MTTGHIIGYALMLCGGICSLAVIVGNLLREHQACYPAPYDPVDNANDARIDDTRTTGVSISLSEGICPVCQRSLPDDPAMWRWSRDEQLICAECAQKEGIVA